MSTYINIAAYKFVDLDDLPKRKSQLLPICKSLGLKGTILLSPEGINMFLAGSRENVNQFLLELKSQPEFSDLSVKESISDEQPFSRLLVRLKKEIISMGVEEIQPVRKTSPKVSPKELKQWLDEGRDITLLDVRNDYEVEIGTFKNALPIGVDNFRRFPAATERLPESIREKPVVMFCTGGIRCEKAGPLMERSGFKQIFQLDGGILKYFEDCGGAHYEGDCFVFDKRVAVDPELNETDIEQCFACQAILTLADQASEKYDPPRTCPNCYQTPAELMEESLQMRTRKLRELTQPLPGSIPYDNVRPMNVPEKFDRQPLIEFLIAMHAKLDREFWQNECRLGHVSYQGNLLNEYETVRAGWRVHHLIPQTTEPAVSNEVGFLYEDESIIAIDKPAPLPMHACGRFNRNTLQYFVALAYPTEQIRIVHRLDAETTGVVLMARKKSAAAFVHRQFAMGQVEKTYLARVIGHPESDSFVCDAEISNQPQASGGIRTIEVGSLASRTEFEVLERFADGTSLLKCFPKTGRTNQIRLHLQHMCFPIVGDAGYGGLDRAISSNLGALFGRELCLHASQINFQRPLGGDWIKVQSRLDCRFLT